MSVPTAIALPGAPRGQVNRPERSGAFVALDNSSPDHLSNRCRILVLPEPQDHPTRVDQRRVGPLIAGSVALDFGSPKLGVGGRKGVVLRTAVPETAVDEYGNLGTCVLSIGFRPFER